MGDRSRSRVMVLLLVTGLASACVSSSSHQATVRDLRTQLQQARDAEARAARETAELREAVALLSAEVESLQEHRALLEERNTLLVERLAWARQAEAEARFSESQARDAEDAARTAEAEVREVNARLMARKRELDKLHEKLSTVWYNSALDRARRAAADEQATDDGAAVDRSTVDPD